MTDPKWNDLHWDVLTGDDDKLRSRDPDYVPSLECLSAEKLAAGSEGTNWTVADRRHVKECRVCQRWLALCDKRKRHYRDLANLREMYPTPSFTPGDTVVCAIRGPVKIAGQSTGPIQWPIHVDGGKILYGALAEAVRQETAKTVMSLFGVSLGTVVKWRKTLDVGKPQNGEVMHDGIKWLAPWRAAEIISCHRNALCNWEKRCPYLKPCKLAALPFWDRPVGLGHYYNELHIMWIKKEFNARDERTTRSGQVYLSIRNAISYTGKSADWLDHNVDRVKFGELTYYPKDKLVPAAEQKNPPTRPADPDTIFLKEAEELTRCSYQTLRRIAQKTGKIRFGEEKIQDRKGRPCTRITLSRRELFGPNEPGSPLPVFMKGPESDKPALSSGPIIFSGEEWLETARATERYNLSLAMLHVYRKRDSKRRTGKALRAEKVYIIRERRRGFPKAQTIWSVADLDAIAAGQERLSGYAGSRKHELAATIKAFLNEVKKVLPILASDGKELIDAQGLKYSTVMQYRRKRNIVTRFAASTSEAAGKEWWCLKNQPLPTPKDEQRVIDEYRNSIEYNQLHAMRLDAKATVVPDIILDLDQKQENNILWSPRKKLKDWCAIFELELKTLKKRFESQEIRNKKRSEQYFCVAIDDIPAAHRVMIQREMGFYSLRAANRIHYRN